MKLPQPLIAGSLIRRYQRFLADIALSTGEVVTAHCPNSGSMKGCAIPGAPVLLSRSMNPKRKLPYTWELVNIAGNWVGINTAHPNALVHEAIATNVISELGDYDTIRPEVRYGTNSRIDLLLSGAKGRCYVEVKNVTLAENGRAYFPDSVTTRGQKHLQELMDVVQAGDRGVILFVVQRMDTKSVSPADWIDPVYGSLLRRAVNAGVEALAYQAAIGSEEIVISHRLPVVLEETVSLSAE